MVDGEHGGEQSMVSCGLQQVCRIRRRLRLIFTITGKRLDSLVTQHLNEVVELLADNNRSGLKRAVNVEKEWID